MTEEREPSRREVAGGVGRLLGGGVLLATGVVSLRFAAWQSPQRAPVVFAAGEGPRLQQGVWLVERGGEVWALDGRCSHLGCAVGLAVDGQGFVCPCHGSRYGLNGAVLHGPADEPLEQLQVERVGGEIHVHWP